MTINPELLDTYLATSMHNLKYCIVRFIMSVDGFFCITSFLHRVWLMSEIKL